MEQQEGLRIAKGKAMRRRRSSVKFNRKMNEKFRRKSKVIEKVTCFSDCDDAGSMTKLSNSLLLRVELFECRSAHSQIPRF
jgi:hypothetical protein